MRSIIASIARGRLPSLALLGVLLAPLAAPAQAQLIQSRYAATVPDVGAWRDEGEAVGAPTGFDCNSNSVPYAYQEGSNFSVDWLTANAFPAFSISTSDTIVDVKARIRLRFDINKSGQVDIGTRTLGTWVMTANDFNIPAVSNGNCVDYTWTVAPPAGGWTVTALQGMALRIRRTTNTTNSGNLRVKAFELIVTYNNPPPSFCEGTVCPCGNTGLPGRGCNNSFNTGGGRLYTTGNSSYSADTLTLTTVGLPTFAMAFLLESGARAQPYPFGDGVLCLQNGYRLWSEWAYFGTVEFGPFASSGELSSLSPLAWPGVTTHYQVVYRDASPLFCTPNTFNSTQGYSVLWTP